MKTSATQNYSPITMTITLETEREKLLWLALFNTTKFVPQITKEVNEQYLNPDEEQYQQYEVVSFLSVLNQTVDI